MSSMKVARQLRRKGKPRFEEWDDLRHQFTRILEDRRLELVFERFQCCGGGSVSIEFRDPNTFVSQKDGSHCMSMSFHTGTREILFQGTTL